MNIVDRYKLYSAHKIVGNKHWDEDYGTYVFYNGKPHLLIEGDIYDQTGFRDYLLPTVTSNLKMAFVKNSFNINDIVVLDNIYFISDVLFEGMKIIPKIGYPYLVVNICKDMVTLAPMYNNFSECKKNILSNTFTKSSVITVSSLNIRHWTLKDSFKSVIPHIMLFILYLSSLLDLFTNGGYVQFIVNTIAIPLSIINLIPEMFGNGCMGNLILSLQCVGKYQRYFPGIKDYCPKKNRKISECFLNGE